MTLTKNPTQTPPPPLGNEASASAAQNEAAYKEDVLNSLLAEFGSSAPHAADLPCSEAPVSAPDVAAVSAAEEVSVPHDDQIPFAQESSPTAESARPSLVVDGVDFSEFLYDAPSASAAPQAVPSSAPTAQPLSREAEPRPAVTRRRNSPGSLALRLFAFAAVLATVFFLYTQTLQNKVSAADFEQVRAAVFSTLSLDEMDQADAQMVRRLYGFTPTEMDGCILYYPTTNMGAHEVLLVKLSDLSQQKTVSDAITARRQTQMASFEGYGIEQYALLERAVIEVQGNYLLFVVHEDAAAARQAFLKAL